MNEIEKKYWDAIRDFAKTNPKIPILFAEKTHLYDFKLSYDSESETLGMFINTSLSKNENDGQKKFCLNVRLGEQAAEYKHNFLVSGDFYGSLSFAIKFDKYEKNESERENKEHRFYLKKTKFSLS